MKSLENYQNSHYLIIAIAKMIGLLQKNKEDIDPKAKGIPFISIAAGISEYLRNTDKIDEISIKGEEYDDDYQNKIHLTFWVRDHSKKIDINKITNKEKADIFIETIKKMVKSTYFEVNDEDWQYIAHKTADYINNPENKKFTLNISSSNYDNYFINFIMADWFK